jgi:hypothetical protein
MFLRQKCPKYRALLVAWLQGRWYKDRAAIQATLVRAIAGNERVELVEHPLPHARSDSFEFCGARAPRRSIQ